jgi:hypothetical protein
MDMADIHCCDDIGSYSLFHSSAKEMIHIHHIMFSVLDVEKILHVPINYDSIEDSFLNL